MLGTLSTMWFRHSFLQVCSSSLSLSACPYIPDISQKCFHNSLLLSTYGNFFFLLSPLLFRNIVIVLTACPQFWLCLARWNRGKKWRLRAGYPPSWLPAWPPGGAARTRNRLLLLTRWVRDSVADPWHFWYGSGSADPHLWLTDKFFCLLLLFEVKFTQFFEVKKS